jgi:predicted glycogen debranching enzyme
MPPAPSPTTPGIQLDAAACRDFDKSIGLEWLSTNGLGGYACGTVAGVNTRKYHGYFVAAAKPPVERYVVLSRVEDRVIIDRKGAPAIVADLSTNEFAEVIHPQGYQNLIGFRMDPGPTWRYEVGDVIIEKSLTMVHGQDTLIVQYKIVGGKSPGPVRLQLQPMFAGRDFHQTIQSSFRPGWTLTQDGDAILLGAPECPVKVILSHNADRFSANAQWWYNFTFRVERQRGYPDREDLWTPGLFEFTLEREKPVGFICSTRTIAWNDGSAMIKSQQERQAKIAASLKSTTSAAGEDANAFLSALAQAADQFLVQRGSVTTPGAQKMSVIAGYPWFEDWGRDTFIALPGLTLVTGRHDVARMILDTFADHRRRGLLPNRFPDKSTAPEYHTVDAALWFVHAAYQYWRYSGESKFLTSYLYKALCEIVEFYRDGTDFDIRMDTADGLLRCGVPGVQLTWMDAKVGDWVVTPRVGKPVEINALWYNALKIMSLVAKLAGDATRAATFASTAMRVERNFATKFFCAETDCLYDVIDDDGKGDASIRPNQLLAVSLPFTAIPNDMAKRIVATTQSRLLTPLGMRTLAPGSPNYRGRCAGDQFARDSAYHQGTAWPWLTGPFISAFVKVNGGNTDARKKAWMLLAPIEDHLMKAGLGSISEIADGDAPHTPRGCPAQAWSVGEVLRCYWEDILGKAPAWPHEMAPPVPTTPAVEAHATEKVKAK